MFKSDQCSFTCWDTWNFEADCDSTTTAKFVGEVEEKYGVKITAVVQGARPVYFPLLGHKDRLPKPLFQFVDSEASETVTKDSSSLSVKLTLLLEPPPSQQSPMDVEDIESPPVYVRFNLKK